MLVLNPPYNIRIAQEKNHEFYNDIGSHLKHEWSGADAWILSGDLEGLKHIGLRPSRKIRMYNGPIETKLIYIPLYKGSKKSKNSEIRNLTGIFKNSILYIIFYNLLNKI